MGGIKIKNTITLEEIKKTGAGSWSKKDNSPRGVTTVSTSSLKVGDEIVIDNCFALIVE